MQESQELEGGRMALLELGRFEVNEMIEEHEGIWFLNA